MPIPIPIPMPVGASAGGSKFSQHHGDSEGEVRKIYLLQPMPKAQPQPQLKGGGFMGTAQTHSHVPSPIKNYRSHQSSYGDSKSQSQQQLGDFDSNDKSHYDHHDSHKSGGKSQSDLKILPIVVIPPIAPMPPIQLPSSTSISHQPRMTLSPQFNNYLVSGSETGDNKNARSNSAISLLHDQKTFSDYGISSGASTFRDNYNSKMRPRVRQVSRSHYFEPSLMSRGKTRMHGDDYGDYEIEPTTWRGQSRHQSGRGGQRRMHSGSLLRRSYHTGGRARVGRNSIRDIIEQQVQFDDEPAMDQSELREVPGNHKVECCNFENSKNHRISEMIDSNIPNFERHQRDMAPSVGERELEDFMDPMDTYRSRTRQSEQEPREESNDKEIRVRAANLNPIYYDRDSQAGSTRSIPGHNLNDRPANYEREIFDDDEWRFDSIISATHTNPSVNSTSNFSTADNGGTTSKPSIAVDISSPSIESTKT